MQSILEHQTGILRSIGEQQKNILEHQTGILRSMSEQQMAFLRSMSEQQMAFFTYMKNQQTSMHEHQTSLLTSINKHLPKLNAYILQNKVEDEAPIVKKGNREQNGMKKEEIVMCDSYVKQVHEPPALLPSSWSSRTEGKKYRLHTVGEVYHEVINENGRFRMNVMRGRQIPHIEVILKHGDEQVPASHYLASVRVELVVLDAKYHIEESTDWPRKEFEDHFMPVGKNSNARMTVEKGKFNLDGGRKVYTAASMKDSSWKKKVRLGVMVVQDGSVQERVLEGVSSNEFYVIHDRRRDATCADKEGKRPTTTGNSELNTNGKRVNSHTTLQPSTSYSQFSGHVQRAKEFGQHATGEQPSHVRNACSTQNSPTALIDAGNIRGTVPRPPQANGSTSEGFPASDQMKLHEAREFLMDDSPDNPGHVDPSSQNLMTGCAQNDIISSILTMVSKIVNELLPPALSISHASGINSTHENLQGLQEQLVQFAGMLKQGHHPSEVLGIPAGDSLLASISKVTGDAEILNCPQVSSEELMTRLGRLDGYLSLFSEERFISSLLSTQPQLTSTQTTRQPGNNGCEQDIWWSCQG